MWPGDGLRLVTKMCTKHQYLQMVLQHDTLQQVKTYKNDHRKKTNQIKKHSLENSMAQDLQKNSSK